MVCRFVICLAFYYGLAVGAVGQQPETVRVNIKPGPYLRFEPFTIDNESFKQGYSKHMALQDSQGYLWFVIESNTTRELIRYDGNYAKSFGAGTWGAFNSSHTIRENAAHEIWTVNEKGFTLFDPRTETFRSFQNPFLKQLPISSWVMEPNGKSWFTALDPLKNRAVQPLFTFDTRTRRFYEFIPSRLINGYTQQSERQQSYSFSPKAVDAEGRVWGSVYTGATSALGCYDTTANILVRYPVHKFLTAADDQKGSTAQPLDHLTAVLPEGKYVWLSSWNRLGLLRLDTQTGNWKQFYFPTPDYNLVLQIIPRNTRQFWLSTGKAPVIFDKTTETLYAYPHKPDNPLTPDAHSYPFVWGNDQSLWMGLANRNYSATLSVLHESKQLFHDKADTLLAITNKVGPSNTKSRKLYYTYYTDYLTFAEYDEYSKVNKLVYSLPLNGFFEQFFYAALPDTVNQTVWVVGKSVVGSIFRFDQKRGTLEPVKASIQGLQAGQNQTENYHEIRAVVQDQTGNVWFPSYGSPETTGGNLIKFDHRTKQFWGLRGGTHGLPTGQIRSAMADSKGQLWLGYRTNGIVIRLDPKTNRAMNILPDTYRNGTDVVRIVEDTVRNVVWIARSMDGLWQYDRRTSTTRRMLREAVLNVHLTKDNNIWLKTLTSLTHYVPETAQLTRLGPAYDRYNFNWSPFSKTDTNRIDFDLFRFYEYDGQPDTVKPRVVLSFLKAFDRDLPLPQSLNFIDAVDLQYDQNFFTVGFSVLSHFQPERNQYAYQLVGFNQDWVRVGNKPVATFTNVPPGRYTLRVRGSNYNGVWSDVRNLALIVHPPFWQTWWFRLLAFGLLLMAAGLLYRFYLERQTLTARLEAEAARRKQKEAELSEKEATFRLKLSETEMSALRSQMNPHFIFNCLNSIQFFTAQNDAQKASDYLTKFSRLIRLVLENSRSDKVTLTNELETLRLYIEMEAMRFPQKLHYQIQVATEIDTDSIHIPPLLVQPFVENAIWHGLMHKDEGGTVRVLVQQPADTLLHIEITDDGVGRQQAAAYKSKSATKRKSFGMKLTADRITLINQLYQTQTQVEVVDLTDEQGKAKGTHVMINIPI